MFKRSRAGNIPAPWPGSHHSSDRRGFAFEFENCASLLCAGEGKIRRWISGRTSSCRNSLGRRDSPKIRCVALKARDSRVERNPTKKDSEASVCKCPQSCTSVPAVNRRLLRRQNKDKVRAWYFFFSLRNEFW